MTPGEGWTWRQRRSASIMKTYAANFLLSAPNEGAFPAPGLPEVAIVGRSNAGKSSLLNALVGRRKLARISGRPGRTRAIVFFEVEQRFLLADLPGYGYAAGPRAEQASWRKLVGAYFDSRRPLRGVIALFDIRRTPDDLDRALLQMLAARSVAWKAIWTKADKLKRRAQSVRSQELSKVLAPSEAGITFSTKTRQGRDDLLAWIETRVREP